MDKKISTTALAKEKGLTKPEVDSILSERGFIARGESGWELTSAGTSAGGEYKESDKYGTYITWPISILGILQGLTLTYHWGGEGHSQNIPIYSVWQVP